MFDIVQAVHQHLRLPCILSGSLVDCTLQDLAERLGDDVVVEHHTHALGAVRLLHVEARHRSTQRVRSGFESQICFRFLIGLNRRPQLGLTCSSDPDQRHVQRACDTKRARAITAGSAMLAHEQQRQKGHVSFAEQLAGATVQGTQLD
jgi:hypothetical protein